MQECNTPLQTKHKTVFLFGLQMIEESISSAKAFTKRKKKVVKVVKKKKKSKSSKKKSGISRIGGVWGSGTVTAF